MLSVVPTLHRSHNVYVCPVWEVGLNWSYLRCKPCKPTEQFITLDRENYKPQAGIFMCLVKSELRVISWIPDFLLIMMKIILIKLVWNSYCFGIYITNFTKVDFLDTRLSCGNDENDLNGTCLKQKAVVLVFAFSTNISNIFHQDVKLLNLSDTKC